MKTDILMAAIFFAVFAVFYACVRLNDVARALDKLNSQVEKEYGR